MHHHALPIQRSSCVPQQQQIQHALRATLARSAPEKVQEQEIQQQTAAGGPSPLQQQQRQFVTADAMTTMQEEQERELGVLTTELPQREQRFEWLAFWVASAVAFGAGIW